MSPGNPNSPRLIKSAPAPTPTSQIQKPVPRGPICGPGCEELFRLGAVRALLIDQRPWPSHEIFEEAKRNFDAHAASCPSDGCTEYRAYRAEMKEFYKAQGVKDPREINA